MPLVNMQDMLTHAYDNNYASRHGTFVWCTCRG